jgi:hypothetical protein
MYLVGFALLNLQFLSSVLLTIICLFVLFILTILIICSSSIYGFWLPLWYLQIFLAIQFDENFCLYISKLLHWTKRCEPSDGILWYSKISLLLGYTCFVGQMIRRKWMLNILKWTAVCDLLQGKMYQSYPLSHLKQRPSLYLFLSVCIWYIHVSVFIKFYM